MTRGRKTTKECKNCNNEFEVLLIKIRQGKGLYCSIDCYNDFRSKNKRDPKYLDRIAQKKYKYGLNESEYLNMFETQNNECAICEKSFNEVRACVDHSHDNGLVRGLLCDKCNKGLGSFNDNLELLKKAVEYLSKYCVVTSVSDKHDQGSG